MAAVFCVVLLYGACVLSGCWCGFLLFWGALVVPFHWVAGCDYRRGTRVWTSHTKCICCLGGVSSQPCWQSPVGRTAAAQAVAGPVLKSCRGCILATDSMLLGSMCKLQQPYQVVQTVLTPWCTKPMSW